MDSQGRARVFSVPSQEPASAPTHTLALLGTEHSVSPRCPPSHFQLASPSLLPAPGNCWSVFRLCSIFQNVT